MAAHDIYAAQLAQLHQGYALWCPKPWAYDEVKVGDVGYIWRGTFFRLFNITIPEGDPANARLGVPLGFVPLELPPDSVYCDDKLYDPGEVLHSSSVKKFQFTASGSGTVLPAGAGLRFECSNRHGAVLMFRRRAIREDTVLRQDFEQYILQNFRSWYKFANDRHRRGLKPGDIMLITGCDKTAEWASAVFSDRGTHAEISFSGGLPTLISGEFAVSGSWEKSSSVQHRTGPICEGPIKYDQTVFIRAFKIRERPLLAPKVIEAAAEPQPPGPRDSEEESVQQNETSPHPSAQLEVEYIPSDQPDFHPSDALMQYILEHSDRPYALVHDDDWCEKRTIAATVGAAEESVSHIIIDYERRFFEEQQKIADAFSVFHDNSGTDNPYQSSRDRRRSLPMPCVQPLHKVPTIHRSKSLSWSKPSFTDSGGGHPGIQNQSEDSSDTQGQMELKKDESALPVAFHESRANDFTCTLCASLEVICTFKPDQNICEGCQLFNAKCSVETQSPIKHSQDEANTDTAEPQADQSAAESASTDLSWIMHGSSTLQNDSSSPQWSQQMEELKSKYPNDKVSVVSRAGGGAAALWQIACADCPEKWQATGSGDAMLLYKLHVNNHRHRQRVSARVQNAISVEVAPETS